MTQHNFTLIYCVQFFIYCIKDTKRCEYESYLRSNEHYCSNSVHYCEDRFHFHVFSAVHMYNFHIFTVIYLSIHGFIWYQRNDQLPVGSLALSVEHCTGITKVMGSNPVQAWIFFRPYFHYCSSNVHYCEDRFHIHVFNRSSHIWFLFIHSHTKRCYHTRYNLVSLHIERIRGLDPEQPHKGQNNVILDRLVMVIFFIFSQKPYTKTWSLSLTYEHSSKCPEW